MLAKEEISQMTSDFTDHLLPILSIRRPPAASDDRYSTLTNPFCSCRGFNRSQNTKSYPVGSQ